MIKYLIVIIILFLGLRLYSQDTEVWIKNSPEIRINFKDTPLELRWRPIDQMIMPDHYFGKHSLVRTDIMFGVTVDKIKLFNYTKFDEFGHFWTGARFDVNLDFFSKKLLLNIQERFFWGLNDDSYNHYYLIQYLRYGVTPKIHLGILSYGKWHLDRHFEQGEWFIGPSAEFRLPFNFSFHTAFAKQIFTTNVYMWYFRLGYKFKF